MWSMKHLHPIISFDIETNGLFGAAFAAAGIIIDEEKNVVDSFVARCPVAGTLDPWVAEHVVPAIASLAETAATERELRDQFWRWLENSMKRFADVYVTVDTGYPVEMHFLAACHGDDPRRHALSPHPLLDVASMLLGAGLDPEISRASFIGDDLSRVAGRKHHPLYDAHVSALTFWHLVERNSSK